MCHTDPLLYDRPCHLFWFGGEEKQVITTLSPRDKANCSAHRPFRDTIWFMLIHILQHLMEENVNKLYHLTGASLSFCNSGARENRVSLSIIMSGDTFHLKNF